MNRTELVAAMAAETQLSKKDAEAALKALQEEGCEMRVSVCTVYRYIDDGDIFPTQSFYHGL